MRRTVHRNTADFSTSFLDLCCCALGGMILLMMLLIPQPKSEVGALGSPLDREIQLTIQIPRFGSASGIRSPDDMSNTEPTDLRPVLTLGAIQNIHLEVHPLGYAHDFGPSGLSGGHVTVDETPDDLLGIGLVELSISEASGSNLWFSKIGSNSGPDSVTSLNAKLTVPVNAEISWKAQTIRLEVVFEAPAQNVVVGTEAFWEGLVDAWPDLYAAPLPNSLGNERPWHPTASVELTPDDERRSVRTATLVEVLANDNAGNVAIPGLILDNGSDATFSWYRRPSGSESQLLLIQNLAKSKIQSAAIASAEPWYVGLELPSTSLQSKSLTFRLVAICNFQEDISDDTLLKIKSLDLKPEQP
ncbi:hypothetical protein SH528x_002159 [Novipirellula sp. SH528]|uniref:hypothetical protein n=1 Tax=Novipirellula sp. SH528 TaxID=3454466 RepID=UPI003F9F8678